MKPLDLEEVFSPTNYPYGLTARRMRRTWRIAARECGKRKDWKYAWEAYVNSWKRFPPKYWTTGVSIL